MDSLGTWQTAVEAGRRRWREKQVKATVRDWQEVAAEALRDLGYAVSDPGDDIPAVPEKAVHGW
ncbi:MAG TPA: hypothetical protein VMV22_00290 [Acidimicrobiales bacterium]|nr:hypothetical protein [Acidimicrobiales bacterium]